MHTEFRYGGLKYLSFILIDIVCLTVSNLLALFLYTGVKDLSYSIRIHMTVMTIMITIDIFVTVIFSSLRRVLRWKKERELYESARHVFYCLIILGVVLFVTKTGAEFSRVVVLIAYAIDYLLICFFRTSWRFILHRVIKKEQKKNRPTVILITTDGFLEEGLDRLRELNLDIKYLFILENIHKEEVEGVPVIKDIKEVASAICWDMIERIYVYGLDHQMVPNYLVRACKEMKLEFELVDFNYRVIDIKTIHHEDSKYGALSILEGKRDIPFPIRRAYWITETEANLHRGFHAHKLNCQLLYCPYGSIDIILDDGEKRETVTLDRPEKGLILMPGLWREMVWNQSGSVLCVLASEYYDAKEYIRDYKEFLSYSKNYRAVAVEKKGGKSAIKKEEVANKHECSICNISSDGERTGIRAESRV